MIRFISALLFALTIGTAQAQTTVAWLTNATGLASLPPTSSRQAVSVGNESSGWSQWNWNAASTASTNSTVVAYTGLATGRWIQSPITGTASGLTTATAPSTGNSVVNKTALDAAISTNRTRSVASVAAMQALTGVANGDAIITLGRYSAGDGGGAVFYYSSSSSSAANFGTVFSATGMGSGRYIWDGLGGINVRMFGAVGDGVTDDTAAIQSAIDVAESYVVSGVTTAGSVIVPPGMFRASSLELTNASLEGTKWTKQPTVASSIIKALPGQTNGALLNIRKSPLGNVGPTIKGLALYGVESNHRATWTISAVASRTSFTVNTNDLPTITTSRWPYFGQGFCLFYDTTDSFAGHGLVSAINATTGVVTLATGWDNYATTGASGANMPVGWKVIFAPYVTETGPSGAVQTGYDYSGFGQNGINYQGYQARLENLFVTGFCVGIRSFGGGSLQIDHVWDESNRFAGYGEFQYGYGADLHSVNWWIQGLYQPDAGFAATPLLDGAYRFTAWGIWGMQDGAVLTEQVVSAAVNSVFDDQGNLIHYNDLFIDVPTLHGIYNAGSSVGDGTISIGKLLVRAPGTGFGGGYRDIPNDRGAKNASAVVLAAGAIAKNYRVGILSTANFTSSTTSNAFVNLFWLPNGSTNTFEYASLGGIGQGYTNYANIGTTRGYHPQLLSGYSYLSDANFWMGGRKTEATNWSILAGGNRSATFGPTVNSNLVALYNVGAIYNAAAITNASTLLQTGAATFNGAMTNTAAHVHVATSSASQERWERSPYSLDFAHSGGWQQWTSVGDNGTLWVGSGIGIFANNLTAATAKLGGVYGLTYDNTLYPLVRSSTSASGNEVLHGGGSASYKSATAHRFYAAATTNVATGTEVFTIVSSGVSSAVPVTATGLFTSTGPVSGFNIRRRDTSADAWQWSSVAGELTLYDYVGVASRMTIAQASGLMNYYGPIALTGSLTTGANGTAITRIRHGRASAMVGGVIAVADAYVTANTRIMLSVYTTGGTVGVINTGTRTASTSFTITSSSVLDTSVVDWVAFEP